jgi:acyl carrier protein
MKEYLEIEAFLLGYLAQRLGLGLEELRPSDRFDNLGLDSAAAVEMMMDLEDWLSRGTLDAVLPYDYPTIRELATHLAQTQDSGERGIHGSAVA